MGFHDSVKKILSKHQNKWYKSSNYWFQESGWLSSDFPGLTNLCSLIDLNSLFSPISSKNFLVLMVWSSLVPKLPILVIFCRMDHQKSFFLLIYGTSSIGGCWGQPMLLFWKLDETQMPKPQKHADTFIIILKLFLVGLRGLQSIYKRVQTPCS